MKSSGIRQTINERPERVFNTFSGIIAVLLVTTTFWLMWLLRDVNYIAASYPIALFFVLSNLFKEKSSVQKFFYVDLPCWIPGVFFVAIHVTFILWQGKLLGRAIEYVYLMYAQAFLMIPYYALIISMDGAQKRVKKSLSGDKNDEKAQAPEKQTLIQRMKSLSNVRQVLKEDPKRIMKALDIVLAILLIVSTVVIVIEDKMGYVLGLYPMAFLAGISRIMPDSGAVKTFFYLSVPYWLSGLSIVVMNFLFVLGHFPDNPGPIIYFLYMLVCISSLFPYYAVLALVELVYKRVKSRSPDEGTVSENY